MMILERLRAEVPKAARARHDREREGRDAARRRRPAAPPATSPSARAGRSCCEAVITVHGGGSVIAPHLAGHLLRQYQKASRGETDNLHNQLSTRELEVLRLVAMGRTDSQIAEEIYVSPRTVQNHLARIRDKTGLRRRSELTRWAVVHAVY